MPSVRYLIIILFFFSCSSPNKYSLTGNIELEDNEKVFLVQMKDNRPLLIDSTSVKNGQFKFSDSIYFPEMHYLFFEKVTGNIPFVLEPGNILIDIYKDSIRTSKISGTKSNQDWTDYLNETQIYTTELNNIQIEINQLLRTGDSILISDLEEQFTDVRGKLVDYEFLFMDDKKDSYISALILQRMIFERSIDFDKADSILNSFDKGLDNTNPYVSVRNIIDNYKLSNIESPTIGSFAPKFTGPGIDGEIISLEQIKSKYILIDFWASWCEPCRIENPVLTNLMKSYSNDDFIIMGVSLDISRDAWMKAIEVDDIGSWIHISNLEYFNGPIVKLYNIRGDIGIPSNFLINEERKIIAKDIKSDELEFILNSQLKNLN